MARASEELVKLAWWPRVLTCLWNWECGRIISELALGPLKEQEQQDGTILS